MFNNGMMGMIPSLADIAAVTGNRNGNGWGMYDVIRIVNTGTAALTVSPGANLIVRKLS